MSLDGKLVVHDELLDVGGIYTLLLDGSVSVFRQSAGSNPCRGDLTSSFFLVQSARVLTVISPNAIHLMWLLPQYIVITVAEVMFSVTGLEFAFTQVSAWQRWRERDGKPCLTV